MANHNAIKSSLKIMMEVPDSIKRAQDNYKVKLGEIKSRESTGRWSPNAIAADKGRAKEDYDRIVSRLMGQMKSAVETLNENNSFEGEAFDFSDPKFQSAISFMQLMGKDMTPVDQINMLENFRGNPGALNALGAAMKKNHLFFADRAKEMTKTLPAEALNDAAYVVGKYEYCGEADFSRMRWSKGEFAKMAERMGYDMGDAPDPYLSALMDARDALAMSGDMGGDAHSSAARLKLDKAIRDINTARATGEGSVEEIFSNAIRHMEMLTAGGQGVGVE